MRTTKAAPRRRLAVLVAAVGFAAAGCAHNAAAPGVSSTTPAPPVVSSTLPATPQPTTLYWAKSTCQALHPAFSQLGTPPKPDLNDPAATRQAYINYLGSARNAAQQTIEQLSLVGPPPVENGQQIFDQMRNQLIQLRKDLDDAVVQLNQADPNDAGTIGMALGAASNVLGALGNRVQVLLTLAANPQLRAAINQTPECQNLLVVNPTTGTNQPTGSPQPPS